MAIPAQGGISVVTVQTLMEAPLHIPPYQRSYRWLPETALQLVDDVEDAMRDTQRAGVPYVLGAVILHEEPDQAARNVVDGQQRLLTLHMLLSLLDGAPSTLPTLPQDDEKAPPVLRVWTALQHRCQSLPDAHARRQLANYIRQHCQLVQIQTDDLDEAFRIFDSQNYRGKSLAPHDLLKAYHLREMQHESAAMKAAVVERWESVPDRELERLFGTYLYRIVQWCRQRKAPGFTLQDIGLFKGISSKELHSPVARYHAAAQALMPALDQLQGFSTDSETVYRQAGHQRFQLDLPLRAGRPFFEMVDFMLLELRHLVHTGFAGERASFCYYETSDATNSNSALEPRSSHARYRFVTELYVAALLMYVNKFGHVHLETARRVLFRWAFSVRLAYLRVQYPTIDNVACGLHNNLPVFAALRDALRPQIIHQMLPVFHHLAQHKDTHKNPDAMLATYLNDCLDHV